MARARPSRGQSGGDLHKFMSVDRGAISTNLCPAFRQMQGRTELFLALLLLGSVQGRVTPMPAWPVWPAWGGTFCSRHVSSWKGRTLPSRVFVAPLPAGV